LSDGVLYDSISKRVVGGEFRSFLVIFNLLEDSTHESASLGHDAGGSKFWRRNWRHHIFKESGDAKEWVVVEEFCLVGIVVPKKKIPNMSFGLRLREVWVITADFEFHIWGMLLNGSIREGEILVDKLVNLVHGLWCRRGELRIQHTYWDNLGGVKGACIVHKPSKYSL
jgi:hypothetical protein